MLRTLLTKCHNYSERSLRSWWTWHGPRWNLLNHVTENSNWGHMTRSHVLNVLNVLNVLMYWTYWTYSRTQSLLWAGVMYLKDRSPYLDSSSLYSKSQNTIKVNLLGTYSTINTYLKTYLSILPSLICIPYSINYKCLWHIHYLVIINTGSLIRCHLR